MSDLGWDTLEAEQDAASARDFWWRVRVEETRRDLEVLADTLVPHPLEESSAKGLEVSPLEDQCS